MWDQVVGLPLVAGWFFVFLFSQRSEEAMLACVALLLLNILSCRRLLKERSLFLAFNGTFAVFLVGRELMALLLPEFEAIAPRPVFAPEVEQLVLILVFVSMLSVRLAFSLSSRNVPTVPIDREASVYVEKVRRLAVKTVAAVFVLNLLVIGERVAFVTTNGYEAYYVHFTSELPLLLSRLGGLYAPALFLYLATFPGRRATYSHLALYVTVSALSLGYGQRNGLALSLLFSLVYLAIRDVLTPSPRKWLSRRMVLFAGLSAIPLIAFLAAFSYRRSEGVIEWTTVGTLTAHFFVSQGSAVFNLGHSIALHDLFPDGRIYSAGPLIGFLSENVIAAAVFGTGALPMASPELAMTGHNFSFALAYLVNPAYYARGGGYGSSFIAELWTDFGVVGVISGSMLYGLLMARFLPWIRRYGPVFGAFALAGAVELVYAPRAGFLGFLTPALSMPTIAAYLAIHVLARRAARRAALRQVLEKGGGAPILAGSSAGRPA